MTYSFQLKNLKLEAFLFSFQVKQLIDKGK
jgi:hypothetical protein